jgi:hypothetical protein
MPTEAMTNELAEQVEVGDIDTAFENLQKQFLFGKHSSLDGKHSSLDGKLVTYNLKEVDVDDVKDLVKSSDWKSWDRRDNVEVFVATSFTKEGKQTTRPKKETKGGASESSECSDREQVTKEIMQSSQPWDKKMHTIAYSINGLLDTLKAENPSRYKKACEVLDPNMVVCWYILVQPSSRESTHVPNEVFAKWSNTRKDAINSVETLKASFRVDMINEKLLGENAKKRKEVLETEGFEHVINKAKQCYSDKRALLEDEIRFRFSEEEEFSSFDIHELNNVNWEEPEDSLVVFAKPASSCLYKSSIHKLIKEFAKSNAFLYTVHTSIVIEKLSKNISGAGNKRLLKVLGNKSKAALNKMDNSDEAQLNKIVSALSKKQLDTLKKLIKNI